MSLYIHGIWSSETGCDYQGNEYIDGKALDSPRLSHQEYDVSPSYSCTKKEPSRGKKNQEGDILEAKRNFQWLAS